ncbi:hypothetical protein [Spirosoma fluviale]|uniref:Uncharacterized protein n=1 Tax=Spirosoma fluviale TaxID=1597977 RepID=A0A286FCY9_9BACT|nr:hypothetical protein [Spirosoma fluviale]SOD81070.1 hypothetical protein SAMN06269250_1664 [Spirosoma fluviale]
MSKYLLVILLLWGCQEPNTRRITTYLRGRPTADNPLLEQNRIRMAELGYTLRSTTTECFPQKYECQTVQVFVKP